MRRAPLAVLLAAAAAAAGVTACGDDADGGGEVRAWQLDAPALPPRDPSTFTERRRAARADSRPTTAGGRAAAGAGQAPSGDGVAAGAPTDAEVEAELREAFGGAAGADVDRAALDQRGFATIPATAPRRLRRLIQAANQVARKPYVYGGGHGRNPNEIWQDSAYDCSGSISFALASAGYIEGPMASGPMMTWGKPGPGKWVSIYANEGHAFMVVAGLRFDTSGRQETGSRWQAAPRSTAGFTVRHPPGL